MSHAPATPGLPQGRPALLGPDGKPLALQQAPLAQRVAQQLLAGLLQVPEDTFASELDKLHAYHAAHPKEEPTPGQRRMLALLKLAADAQARAFSLARAAAAQDEPQAPQDDSPPASSSDPPAASSDG